MTRNDSNEERTDGSTRRTVLKTGSAALAAAGLAGSSLGTVAAQDDDEIGDDLFVEDEASKGLMFATDFEPGGLFTIASPVIDFVPDVEEVEDELFDQYNTRIVRYVQPGTRNVPLFPQQDAPIGPFEEEFGFVVDDDFVEEDEVVLDGEPIDAGGVDPDELRQLRPTIFALERTASFFGGSEEMVTVRFSPIPEEEEEEVFAEFENEIFGTENPFQPAPGGALDGGNQTGNQTGGNSTDLL